MDDQDEVLIPLSLLVDRLGSDRRRNESFVRDLSAWLSERADRISLDAIELLGLVDVVLTFRMKDEVTLVATGRRPDVPGEVTVRFREDDFPHLWVAAHRDSHGNPYRICTLDHSVEGRRVVVVRAADGVPADALGTAIVDATLDGDRKVRVQLDDRAEPVNLPPEAVRFVDEA